MDGRDVEVGGQREGGGGALEGQAVDLGQRERGRESDEDQTLLVGGDWRRWPDR